MKLAVFSVKPYDSRFLTAANEGAKHELTFFEPRLTPETARLAEGFPGVCAFVNDRLDESVLVTLHKQGTRLIALRCAGFNHVDLAAAERLGLVVTRVPAYSPHAVAEHAVGMMLSLNRKLHRAYARVRDGNFSLEGLLGFDMRDRVVGIVGTGKIGSIVAKILRGFDCRLLAFDRTPSPELVAQGVRYLELDELLAESHIVTLHCPLTPETRHLIDDRALTKTRANLMLINTSRGALVDTAAVTRALKEGRLGYLGLDVYEEEGDLFFEDLSSQVIRDDVFTRLLTFPNVLITGHQAFFTRNALESIARQTIESVTSFERGETLTNVVTFAGTRS